MFFKKIIFSLLVIVRAANSSDFFENLPYRAPNELYTDRTRLVRVARAEHDIVSHKAIWLDCGFRNGWFSGDPTTFEENVDERARIDELTEEKLIENEIFQQDVAYFKVKQKKWGYHYPMSFRDYLILDKKTDEFLGRFIFRGEVVDGRIEKGIYLLKQFRGQGIAVEVQKCILVNIIHPAIGKPFTVSECEPETSNVKIWHCTSNVYPEFKGLFSNIIPCNNYQSVSANLKLGFGISWRKTAEFVTFYPPEGESHMSLEDMKTFKELVLNLSLIEALNDSFQAERILCYLPSKKAKIPFDFQKNILGCVHLGNG